MKKNLLVIVKNIKHETVVEAFHAIEDEHIDVTFASLDDVSFDIAPGACSVHFPDCPIPFHEFDMIYVRSLKQNIQPYSVIRTLYPHIPSLQPIPASTTGSKILQYALFAKAGLPFPRTLFFNSLKEEHIEEIEHACGYPIVAKGWQASHGENAYLLRSREDFTLYPILHGDTKFVFQPFIHNFSDMRLVVTGDTVPFGIKRVRQRHSDEWRNNTSLGAERIILDEIPESIKDLAIKATRAEGLSIGGVDIIVEEGTGNLFLLEVNIAPEFKPGTAEAVCQYARSQLLSLS